MKTLHNAVPYQYLPILQQPFVQREAVDVYGFTALRLYGFTRWATTRVAPYVRPNTIFYTILWLSTAYL